jgi:hypothetical protein
LPLHPQADFAPIAQFHEAGVHYVSINIGMDMNPLPQVMATIAGFRATIAAQPDRYVLVNTAQEIRDAAAAGKLAIGFDLEGAMPLLEEPAMVALYRSLGVRQMHLAYNRNNSVAGGCHDDVQGLTPLGQRIVAGGGAGEETFAYSAPAVKHLLQQDAEIRWLGNIDDRVTGDDPVAVELRAAFRSGDGSAPVDEPEREAFITFVRERFA